MKKTPIVALIYDFDGTLSPGNMQEFGFIQAIGKSPAEFWQMSDDIAIGQDASNILSYMKLMFDEARKAGISLQREKFRSFGKSIELFDGVREWFGLINEYGRRHGVTVEHYINSSGLAEILYDENGNAVWPGVAVDYTAKTQFIFKINKGILSIRDNKLVNESQLEENKRIPFPHMIYFGDGETDVPCMKIVKMFGGHSIAVYNPLLPGKHETAKKLLKQKRVNFITPACYTEDSRTFKVVCSIIDKIKADHELQRLSSFK